MHKNLHFYLKIQTNFSGRGRDTQPIGLDQLELMHEGWWH